MAETTTLLIPGLLCDEVVWQPLLRRLNGKAEVADLSTQDDLTQMARDCLALHSGPFYLAAHSMGARVALEMARLAPERIKRMIVLDTGIHPLGDGEKERRADIVRYAYEQGMAALADRWLPGMVYEANRENPVLMKTLTDMVLRMDAALHERQITALVNRPDAQAHLSRIECPVLIIVGRQDQWSPVSQHEDLLNRLPNARLEIIEDAGHFSLLEQPDTVSQLMADFLTAP